MRIGIGIPSTVLDVPGRTLVAWARRAEERGFSTLGTIDRVAYPSYDSLTALAAAGAATEEIGLLTNILLAAAYNPYLLAKVTASVDQVSGGRLTLGVGVGNRADDYDLTGRSFADRGRRFDRDLELLHRAWAGEAVADRSGFPVGPPTVHGRIPLLIGGQADLAVPRTLRWDAGFTIGGAPPEMAADAIQAVRAAWERAGAGQRPIVALSYFSLGEEHAEESLHNLRTYYGFLGDWAEGVASGAPRTPAAVEERAAAFERLGVDELVFDATVADIDQVDRLADVVG